MGRQNDCTNLTEIIGTTVFASGESFSVSPSEKGNNSVFSVLTGLNIGMVLNNVEVCIDSVLSSDCTAVA